MSYYESHGLQNKELPFIYKERKIIPTASRSHGSNWHENVEILYVVEGVGEICNNGHALAAAKGDIFPINANHLHSLCAKEKNFCFRYLIVDRAFCMENGLDTNTVSFDMKVESDEARSLMEALHTAYQELESARYGVLEIRTLVLQIMLLLCRKYGTATEQPEHTEPSITRIKQAIDYIRASYDKPVTLEDAAAFAGVSSCYLSHEFRKYTGQTFVEYVNRTRCNVAEHLLLTTSLGVFEIGRRCGFENRSYFAKTFRRYFGMSPAEYRVGGKAEQTPRQTHNIPQNGAK